MSNTNKKETLCWSCEKCTNGDECSWVKNFTPIDGWKAKKTVIVNNDNNVDSYLVVSCPNFEVASRRTVTLKEISKITGISTACRNKLSKKELNKITNILKEKGYKLKRISYSINNKVKHYCNILTKIKK